jgi:hypothetical protein
MLLHGDLAGETKVRHAENGRFMTATWHVTRGRLSETSMTKKTAKLESRLQQGLIANIEG